MIIDAQVHAYERDHPGRPWVNRLHGPAEMTGDQMAMIRHRMNAEPMRVAEVAPRIPADLAAVVDRYLARRKEDRYATMADVAAALRALPIAPKGD